IFDEQSSGSFLFGANQDLTNSGRIREVCPDWWGAVADGTVDTGSEINAAINSLNDNGGIVFLRAGVWHIHTQVNLKNGITIQGVGYDRNTWVTETSVSDLSAGTWIAQDSNIKIFSIEYNGTTIKDLGFWQDHPTPGGGAYEPTAYTNYVITYNFAEGSDRPDDSTLENLMFLNIYNAIIIDDLETGTNEGAAVILLNIKGQIFNRFFRSEWNWGGINVRDVQIWPFWSTNANVVADTKGRAVIFDLEISDGAHFDTIQIYGAWAGWLFSKGRDNPGVYTDHAPDGLVLNNLQIEQLRFGIYIDADIVGGGPWRKVLISNSSFSGSEVTNSYGIYVAGDNYHISLDNVWMLLFDASAIYTETTATGNTFFVDNAYFYAWNGLAALWPAIEMKAGNTAYIGNNVLYTGGGGVPPLVGAGTFYTSAGAVAADVSIEAAGTITIPPGVTGVEITGTATITAIEGGWRHRIVTLIFVDDGNVVTVQDNANIRLAGNFVENETGHDDTLTLIGGGGGASWWEMSRSIN
ncbi:hypothetical protein LCGC14_2273990, partial [marine sediment metagenome]